MVYVVLKSVAPSHKSEEIAKIVIEMVKKYPPDESLGEALIRGAGRSTEKGYEGMTIWKVKEGLFEKVVIRIMSAMSMFDNVEGCSYSMEVWATSEEIAAAG